MVQSPMNMLERWHQEVGKKVYLLGLLRLLELSFDGFFFGSSFLTKKEYIYLTIQTLT